MNDNDLDLVRINMSPSLVPAFVLVHAYARLRGCINKHETGSPVTIATSRVYGFIEPVGRFGCLNFPVILSISQCPQCPNITKEKRNKRNRDFKVDCVSQRLRSLLTISVLQSSSK